MPTIKHEIPQINDIGVIVDYNVRELINAAYHMRKEVADFKKVLLIDTAIKSTAIFVLSASILIASKNISRK